MSPRTLTTVLLDDELQHALLAIKMAYGVKDCPARLTSGSRKQVVVKFLDHYPKTRSLPRGARPVS